MADISIVLCFLHVACICAVYSHPFVGRLLILVKPTARRKESTRIKQFLRQRLVLFLMFLFSRSKPLKNPFLTFFSVVGVGLSALNPVRARPIARNNCLFSRKALLPQYFSCGATITSYRPSCYWGLSRKKGYYETYDVHGRLKYIEDIISPHPAPSTVYEQGDDLVRVPTFPRNYHDPIGVVDAAVVLNFIHVMNEE